MKKKDVKAGKGSLEAVRYVIAFDNGVSGYYTILSADGKLVDHGHVPVKRCLNYTKEEQHLSRIDVPKLRTLLSLHTVNQPQVLLERPMINNTRFKQSMSAIRAFEATIIVLEEVGLTYEVVDSKQWQRSMLPGDIASDQLKAEANKIAKAKLGEKIVEGDSALMALWAHKRVGQDKNKL